jgi:CMP-N-acetylneuraminic acid synthetase
MNGKPLVAYTVEASLSSSTIFRTILSTDDNEIADVGREFGADVPFMRPAELALDTTPTLPVVEHALLMLREVGEEYDAVCLLQPTNPLRQPADVDACVNLLERSDADSVISVLPVPHEYNPRWVFFRGREGELSLSTGEKEPIARRQELPPAVHRDGTVYVTRTKTILEEKSLYGKRIRGYEIDPLHSANIDTEDDWVAAEKRVRELIQK